MKQLLFIAMMAIVFVGCKKEDSNKACNLTTIDNFTTSQTDSTFSISFTGDLTFTPSALGVFNVSADTSYRLFCSETPKYFFPDTQYIFRKSKLYISPGNFLNKPFHVDSGGWKWTAGSSGMKCTLPVNYKSEITLHF